MIGNMRDLGGLRTADGRKIKPGNHPGGYLKTNLVNIPKAAEIHDRLLATHGKEFADNVYRAFIADESYLRSAWKAMGNNFITEKLGISREAIDAFRNMILEG
jgi:protein-tyrosine phosphatase